MPARALSGVAIEPAAEASARAIAQALLEGFDRHYALFRDCARAAKRHFEDGNWRAISPRRARPHRLLRPAGGRDGRAHRARVHRRDGRPRRRRAVGARQAALHRPADRAPAAGVRRDVLQLGVVQDPAPHVLPQPLHLRAAGGLHRAHRRRPADVPQLLPASQHGPARRADRHRARLPARARFADFRRDLRNVLAAFRAPLPAAVRGRGEPTRSRCSSSLFFRNQTAYVVGRVVNGMHVHAVRRADQARRGRAACYVDALLTDAIELALLFSANRAYFLVDMEVPSAYVDFLRAVLPDKTRLRALHDGRPAEARQEPLLPRLPAPPAAFDATASSSPPASRGW